MQFAVHIQSFVKQKHSPAELVFTYRKSRHCGKDLQLPTLQTGRRQKNRVGPICVKALAVSHCYKLSVDYRTRLATREQSCYTLLLTLGLVLDYTILIIGIARIYADSGGSAARPETYIIASKLLLSSVERPRTFRGLVIMSALRNRHGDARCYFGLPPAWWSAWTITVSCCVLVCNNFHSSTCNLTECPLWYTRL